MCGAQVSQNVAGWTPADFELERGYYAAILSHGEKALKEPVCERYRARLDEIGEAHYGKHYAGATDALVAVLTQWWATGGAALSKDELLAVMGGTKWAAA